MHYKYYAHADVRFEENEPKRAVQYFAALIDLQYDLMGLDDRNRYVVIHTLHHYHQYRKNLGSNALHYTQHGCVPN